MGLAAARFENQIESEKIDADLGSFRSLMWNGPQPGLKTPVSRISFATRDRRMTKMGGGMAGFRALRLLY